MFWKTSQNSQLNISVGDFQNIVSVSATKNNVSEFAPRYYLSVCFYRNNFVSLMPGINPWKCKYTYIFVNFKTKTISYIFFYIIKDPKKLSHVLSTRSPLLQILKFLIFITDPESNFVTDFKFLCLATTIFEKENVSDYRTPTSCFSLENALSGCKNFQHVYEHYPTFPSKHQNSPILQKRN